MWRCYAICRAAGLHERAGRPLWSEHEATVMFRRPEPGERWTFFGAFEGEGAQEEMVGNAFMMRPMLDNKQFAWLGVNVEPERRGRGIGGALLERLVAAA